MTSCKTSKTAQNSDRLPMQFATVAMLYPMTTNKKARCIPGQ
jgi:hypothetical protein